MVVGGWAHRLHRLHSLAGHPTFPPLQTRDVDLALSLHAPLDGDVRKALEGARFKPVFLGSDTPPVTHYRLGDEDAGFYAEFQVPLHGSERKRDGTPNVTTSKAGINLQKLRHLDLLLVAPFSVHVGPETEIAVGEPVDILVPNPVSFIVQKLLIHQRRKANKQAQDVVYIHDTLELFGAALEVLRTVWTEQVRPAMPPKTAKRALDTAHELFGEVNDTIREAARIPVDRRLTPDIVRNACDYGLREVLVA